jgi:hypothetical protein
MGALEPNSRKSYCLKQIADHGKGWGAGMQQLHIYLSYNKQVDND